MALAKILLPSSEIRFLDHLLEASMARPVTLLLASGLIFPSKKWLE